MSDELAALKLAVKDNLKDITTAQRYAPCAFAHAHVASYSCCCGALGVPPPCLYSVHAQLTLSLFRRVCRRASDFRFAAQCNQAKGCWTWFNEYLVCKAKLGEDAAPCTKALRNLTSLCPSEWVRVVSHMIKVWAVYFFMCVCVLGGVLFCISICMCAEICPHSVPVSSRV
jgi:hypothetical protein